MPTLDVIVDKSSLPKRLDHVGVGFERLCELARSGVVKVYISEVVRREWVSHVAEDLFARVSSLQQAAAKLSTHPLIDRLGSQFGANEWLSRAVEGVPANELQNVSEAAVDELLTRLDAEVLGIGVGHGARVLDAYFSGGHPFEKAKNRDDFPDSFIYEAAKDLQQSIHKIHCIVSDRRLREAMATLPGSTVHSCIDEFVKSEDVESVRKGLRLELFWTNWLSTYEGVADRLSDSLEEKLKDLASDLLGFKHVEHERIPGDSSDAAIVLVDEPHDVTFDWFRLEDMGGGWVKLPATFQVSVDTEFLIHRSDAFNVPEGVWVNYRDAEADHYYEAGGALVIEVSALMSFHIPEAAIMALRLEKPDRVQVEQITEIKVIESKDGTIFH